MTCLVGLYATLCHISPNIICTVNSTLQHKSTRSDIKEAIFNKIVWFLKLPLIFLGMTIGLLIWNFVVCIFLLSRCKGEAKEAFCTAVSKQESKYITYQNLRIKKHNEDCIVRLLCMPDLCQICLHLFLTFTDAVHINVGKLLFR